LAPSYRFSCLSLVSRLHILLSLVPYSRNIHPKLSFGSRYNPPNLYPSPYPTCICVHWAELSYFATDNEPVIRSVLTSSPSVTLDQIFAEVTQLRGWFHGASSRTGLSSLFDPVLESSSLDPLWSLLCLTLSGVFFARPSLESSSLDPLWSLLHLTLSGVFFTWPSLESSVLSQSVCRSRRVVWSLHLCPLYVHYALILWIWKQHGPPKRLYPAATLHDATAQRTTTSKMVTRFLYTLLNVLWGCQSHTP
jgi:hypothetical protein